MSRFHPPLLTLSTLRVNAKQGRRKRSKVADGQCVKRCHLVTDTLARLLPIAVPANLPENALDAPSLAENIPIYITVPKLPYSIPKGE